MSKAIETLFSYVRKIHNAAVVDRFESLRKSKGDVEGARTMSTRNEATKTEPRISSRVEKICRSEYPRTILVKIEDLSLGEILVTRDENDGKRDIFEPIAAIVKEENFVQTEDEHGFRSGQSQISSERDWHILDLPRVGSTWEMMHGRLRIEQIRGTSPEEIEIIYKDLFYVQEYEQRPPVSFRLWSQLRKEGLLLFVEPEPEARFIVGTNGPHSMHDDCPEPKLTRFREEE